jgi:hypothetical protein
MPWLHETNPDINWKSLSILTAQIQLAKLAEFVSASRELPSEFQEFSEVLEKNSSLNCLRTDPMIALSL